MAVPHDPSVKGAVMAALLAGQRVGEVAEQHGLPIGTVRRWAAEARTAQALASQKKDDDDPDAPDFGSLLRRYIVANLETLAVQAEFVRDRAWLAEQDAPGLAVLHGVMVDKSARLLGALEAAEPIELDPTGPGDGG